ncbi:MAG: GAF domain-containing sensor histidine kinase [Solirubrobacterales bacterium]|nr:GAF domain-containing sensor histidine kinase [Solirubrobacterales bacterium]
MSAGSASPPTERPAGVDPLALERLIGVRSSKPSFYAAWRHKSARLDHTSETLERISAALCATPEGPDAVCHAVVDAAAHHFDARWVAMMFSGDRVVQRSRVPRRTLEALAESTLASQRPVVLPDDAVTGQEDISAAAAPMSVHGAPAGMLAVGLPDGVVVEPSDLSILVTLANHAGVALHNAGLFQENERRAAELERRGSELEGTRRRLEQAGRRRLLSEERNRIARELHDSVAQHLLTIGMQLEWCRRHESTSPTVRARVTATKSLARAAVAEIREVIFELANDGRVDLRRALREVIEDVEAGTHLTVGLRAYGDKQPLADLTQHALVQIAREALFNVVRHADADHAWLTLRWRSSSVSLAVADDGIGDAAALHRRLLSSRPSRDHLGLAGIAERVRRLGGTASFTRRRGGGVKLNVEVPLGGTVGLA